MAVTTSSSFSKALAPGVNTWFGETYDEFPVEWTALFDQFTSRKQYEEDVGFAGLGLAVEKKEGAAVQYDSERQGFTNRYTHTEWALGFIVTQIAFEDDQYDVIAERRARGLAFSMRQTKELNGANVYNRAFNTSYTGGDALCLLNSAHLNVSGGTYSNILSTAANLSEAALEQAVIDLGKYTNDRGLKIAVRGQKLVIPVDLEFEAARILKNVNRPGTAERDINALVTLGKFPGGVIMNHYLTSTTAWFIKTSVQNGMKYFSRRDDSFGEDNDFDTSNAKFKAAGRYSFGWTDPRGLYGTAGV